MHISTMRRSRIPEVPLAFKLFVGHENAEAIMEQHAIYSQVPCSDHIRRARQYALTARPAVKLLPNVHCTLECDRNAS
jgi:hypothetical protein